MTKTDKISQEDLKPEQEEAWSKLLDGTSVFASLPTGAGKSRIYGAFPQDQGPEYNRALRRVARGEGADWIDLTNRFPVQE